MKTTPRKPVYAMKMKKPDRHVGIMKNHDAYKEGEYAEMIKFRAANSLKVWALMDVLREEAYLVPPYSKSDPQDIHDHYAVLCNRRNVPFIDGDSEFPIAIPFQFYLDLTEEFGFTDQYENCLKFKEMIEKKWFEWKEANGN